MNVSPRVDERYINTKKAREILGISSDTLRNWSKLGKINTIRTPSGIRMYNREDIYRIAGIDLPTKKKRKIAYCRVTSKNQEASLVEQEEFFRSNYPEYEVVSDYGSGINWKRKGLNSILEQSIKGDIESVMVTHKDRLSRFAFNLIKNVLSASGTELIVLNSNEQESDPSELANDILTVIHSYSSRSRTSTGATSTGATRTGATSTGATRTRNRGRGNQNKKDQDIPEQESEGDTDHVDGCE